jgi:hypothetical protein
MPKPFKFVKAYGPQSDSESEYSYSESDSESSTSDDSNNGTHRIRNDRRRTTRSDEFSDDDDDMPRQDNIKIKARRIRNKYNNFDETPSIKKNKNTIRKKTMPNESEEDSDDSDVVDSRDLDDGVQKTNEKVKDVTNELFIKPIYMHKLYVGNTCAAERQNLLYKLDIRTIISLSDNEPLVQSDDVFVYHHGEIRINSVNSMNKDTCILMIKIINRSISNGHPVLIQCDTGIESSIMLTLLYLSTIDNGLSIIQKYDWLKRKVPETILEKDPDQFFIIQSNINRIFTLFMDDVIFNEYCQTILEKL